MTKQVSRITYKVSGMENRAHTLYAIPYTKYMPRKRGFTLVEMIVAVALFAVVMLVAVGALLSLVAANRKAQALQSVMNNLDITLDGMSRAIRMGSNFHCGTENVTVLPLPTADCAAAGDTVFAFEPYGNSSADPPWVYTFNSSTHRIEKQVNGGTSVAITAPEVTIDDMRFYTVGSTRGCTVSPCDVVQPKVVIVIKGTAPVQNSKARTSFHVQVTAVQRLLYL